MMQKRTNPLELKVENPARARRELIVDPIVAPDEETMAIDSVFELNQPEETPIEQASAEPIPMPAPKAEKALESKVTLTKRQQIPPVIEEPEVEAVVQENRVPASRPVKQEPEKAAPVMNGAVTWQMVTPKKVAPSTPVQQLMVEERRTAAPQAAQESPAYVAPMAQRKPVAAPAEPIEDEDDILNETVEEEAVMPTSVQEAAEEYKEKAPAAENPAATDGVISDEQMPLVLEDYAMAARFSLRGRISRGMKVGKISRDVCRLAQLMHPEQSLSSILEDALLTRIYLENRDAFDALAEMLEKKGGHIKC